MYTPDACTHLLRYWVLLVGVGGSLGLAAAFWMYRRYTRGGSGGGGLVGPIQIAVGHHNA